MADKTLGEVIRDGRIAKGQMKLRELARLLGVTPSYVSDIENDRRVPSEDVLGRIAAALDLDYTDLVARAGRLGAEAERYMRREPTATTLFRKISDRRLNEEQLRELIEQVEAIPPDDDGGTP